VALTNREHIPIFCWFLCRSSRPGRRYHRHHCHILQIPRLQSIQLHLDHQRLRSDYGIKTRAISNFWARNSTLIMLAVQLMLTTGKFFPTFLRCAQLEMNDMAHMTRCDTGMCLSGVIEILCNLQYPNLLTATFVDLCMNMKFSVFATDSLKG
jgi:hypothetical protein